MLRPILVAALLASCGPANQPSPEPTRTSQTATPSLPVDASTDSGNQLSCTWPVDGNKDTAASVLKRFGKDAVRTTVLGPEAIEMQVIVLWKDDPKRRIDLILDDENPHERIFGVQVEAPQSQWQIAGLGMGDPLKKVIAVNGRSFSLLGFSWDYGGYVSDLKGGKLDALPGCCELGLRLDLVDEVVEAGVGILGDVELDSSDQRLSNRRITISELSLNWR
jgi:hypothetical protein